MTKKSVLSLLLALALLVGIIPMTMLNVSADVDEGSSGQGLQMPTPQNVSVTFIGFIDPSSGKAVVVDISWDALSNDVDGGNKFVEMWPTLKEDANLNLPMSFEAWMGQATLIPVEELQEGGIGYITKDGRSTLRSVVHLLQPGDMKVDESGMALGIKENDVIDIDLYTAGYDPETQTSGESDHVHVEVVYTEENVKNKKVFKQTGDTPAECTHENQDTKAEVLNVKGAVTIEGKSTKMALLKETEECTDCHQKKTTKVYRLKFKSRWQMQRFFSGKNAKLSNGKRVHFKGKYEKVEKVFWNKKVIKVSKAYNKKQGSVILEFTDEFLASVEDGVHELMVVNGDEFSAMTVTVQNHEMVELGAFDLEGGTELSADDYEAFMQDCEENGIEVVDCDLDAFHTEGFMINAMGENVAMSLTSETAEYADGLPVELPLVMLTVGTVKYYENKDYTLHYMRVSYGDDGEEICTDIHSSEVTEIGDYAVAAKPTQNGMLFGELYAPFSVVEPEIILGDVDGDKDVTILDANAIQRQLASLPTVFNEAAADADGEEGITILDATAIQRYLAALSCNELIGQMIVH